MRKVFVLLSAVVVAIVITYCSTDNGTEDQQSTVPVLSTITVSNVTLSTAMSGGNITSSGGESVTARGVVWSASQNPTVSLTTKTSDGTGTGSFTSNLMDLNLNTTYYIRAYATNSVGTAYGNEVSFNTSSGIIVTDIDGNDYQTVIICDQTWIMSNLNVSRYKDGTEIPQVTDPTEWKNMTTGAWCYYENDTENGKVYGKLYNWYAVHDSKGLAPEGYHIPSLNEWETLVACLGGESVAGGKMKEQGLSHWNSPNTGANNSSGFNGLPGGSRYLYEVYIFGEIQQSGGWWSSTESNSDQATFIYLYNNSAAVQFVDNYYKESGYSVRCIKD